MEPTEEAAYKRFIDFMAKMLEKYGAVTDIEEQKVA